jgi:hypothetical protein
MWWFAANLTTYLLAAAAYEFGKRVLDVFSLSTQITAAFPLSRIPDLPGVDIVGDRARGNRRGPARARHSRHRTAHQASRTRHRARRGTT